MITPSNSAPGIPGSSIARSMYVLFEESGDFKVGTVLADNTTSLQVETLHGRRTKVKAAHVVLRFRDPAPGALMEQAQKLADTMESNFLWECSGEGEFGFEELAADYYGRAPGPVEAAAVLLRLFSAPMYFYRRGKGRFKAAPPDALKAALAGLEKKRLQAEQQAQFVARLKAFTLPPEFRPLLHKLLYAPDKNSLEWKALDAASGELGLTAVRLLEQCGALPSSHDYHLNRFLFEHFPRGTGFPELPAPELPAGLPLATVPAFSIDDAATTEIDDAFSLERLGGGRLRVGIHIAAPALALTPGSALDQEARKRLSTVYMPGRKITMLPQAVIEQFTLGETRRCPALSMYLELSGDDGSVLSVQSRLEQVDIAVNLRHDTLELQFNEESLARGRDDYPFASELRSLWDLANRLEAARGKADSGNGNQVDYNFHVDGERVRISERRRGSPIDKVVAELMIQANQAWGKALADAGVAAIYRAQGNGKVKMTTVPAPHQGLGVGQYVWASSPLRRYVDLVNQRQLIAMVRGEAPPYAANSEDLLSAMREFELAYEAYGDFQRTMERYWCLRWLIQEGVRLAPATVLRDGLVKFDSMPFYHRVPSLPDLPAGSRVEIEVADIDLLELSLRARFERALVHP